MQFANGVPRSDVSLINNSQIDVVARGGGSITINANNLKISESFLIAGIEDGAKADSNRPGEIILNAAATAKVEQNSIIQNNAGNDSEGNVGNVRINAKSFAISDESQLSSSTFGQGNAGNVLIQVSEAANLESASRIFTVTGDRGNAGNIRVQAGSLTLTNNSVLNTTSYGSGNAGGVFVEANGAVFLSKVRFLLHLDQREQVPQTELAALQSNLDLSF